MPPSAAQPSTDGRRADDRAHVPVDARIAALAQRQHGVVTTADLRAIGLTRHEIQGRVARGQLHRRHRGVYAVGHLADIPLAAEHAALLACGPSAALSHRSAAAFWKLLPSPSMPEVTVPSARRARHPGLRVHRTERLEEVWNRRGLRVTSPRRTLVDLAATATLAELRRAVNEAHVQALVHPSKLVIDEGRPGAARMREVLLGQRRGKTKSGVERKFLRLVAAAGLPPPETNVLVAGIQVDALWRKHHVAVEVDTFWTHDHKAPRRRDPKRDLVLRREGLTPVRVTDEQLDDEPVAVAVMLAGLLR